MLTTRYMQYKKMVVIPANKNYQYTGTKTLLRFSYTHFWHTQSLPQQEILVLTSWDGFLQDLPVLASKSCCAVLCCTALCFCEINDCCIHAELKFKLIYSVTCPKQSIVTEIIRATTLWIFSLSIISNLWHLIGKKVI